MPEKEKAANRRPPDRRPPGLLTGGAAAARMCGMRMYGTLAHHHYWAWPRRR